MKYKVSMTESINTSNVECFFQLRSRKQWCLDNISSEGLLWSLYVDYTYNSSTIFCFVQESDALMFKLLFPRIIC